MSRPKPPPLPRRAAPSLTPAADGEPFNEDEPPTKPTSPSRTVIQALWAAFQFLTPDMQLALIDFARLLPSIPRDAVKRLVHEAEREAGVR